MEIKNKPGIYYIRNLVNNKMYIGQSEKVLNRIKSHIYQLETNSHHNNYLQNSFNKYGYDSFEFGIITYCDSSVLLDYEIKFISLFNTFIPNGYNLTKGGDGAPGKLCSESQRDKLSRKVVLLNDLSIFETVREAAEKYDVDPINIISCCRNILSYAGRDNNDPLVWMYFSDYDAILNSEKDRYISNKLAIANSTLSNMYCESNKTPVVCLNNGMVFDSIKSAAKYANIKNPIRIINVLNKKARYAGKINDEPIVWSRLDEYELLTQKDIDNLIKNAPIRHFQTKQIVCLNTGDIYISVQEAARQTGIKESSLSDCCNGKLSCTITKNGNLAWAFLSDYELMNEDEIENKIDIANKQGDYKKTKVICINTGEIFNSMVDAASAYGISKGCISACCRGITKRGGKNKITGEKYIWKYYVE